MSKEKTDTQNKIAKLKVYCMVGRIKLGKWKLKRNRRKNKLCKPRNGLLSLWHNWKGKGI